MADFVSLQFDINAPWSLNFTLSGNSDRVVIAAFGNDQSGNINEKGDPTFNGVAMTKLGIETSTNTQAGLWYIKDAQLPAAGSYTAAYAGANETGGIFAVAEYKDIDQAADLATLFTQDQALGTTVVSTAVSVPEGAIQVGSVFASNAGGFSVVATQDLRLSASGGGGSAGFYDKAYPAADAAGTLTATAVSSSRTPLVVVVLPTVPPTDPEITDVTPASPQPGEAGVVITVLNDETSQQPVSYDGNAVTVTNWVQGTYTVTWPDVTAEGSSIALETGYPLIVAGSAPVQVETAPETGYRLGVITANDTGSAGYFDTPPDTGAIGDTHYGVWSVEPTDLSRENEGAARGITLPSTYTYQRYDTVWSNVAVETFQEQGAPPEPPTQTAPIPDQNVPVQYPITSIDLTDYFSGATSYTADQLPAGVTLAAATISGTPTALAAAFATVITATNLDGSVQDTFLWDIFSQAALNAPANLNLMLADGEATIAQNDPRITNWLDSATAVDDDGVTADAVADDWTRDGTLIGPGTYPVVFDSVSALLVANQANRDIIIRLYSPVPLNATLNDAILYVTGGPTVNDGLMNYYLANGATEGTLNDLERQFLLAQPQTTSGTNMDLWGQLLTALGYTGTRGDQMLQFWIGGGV